MSLRTSLFRVFQVAMGAKREQMTFGFYPRPILAPSTARIRPRRSGAFAERQRDLPPGGPVPAVPFDGHCRANLASWLVRCRASPSESVGFGIVDGRRLCFPLSLPPQPTPDHPHAPGRSEPYGRGGQDTTAHGDPERALVVPSEVVQHSRHPRPTRPRAHARRPAAAGGALAGPAVGAADRAGPRRRTAPNLG
jgi:hypothetical protein